MIGICKRLTMMLISFVMSFTMITFVNSETNLKNILILLMDQSNPHHSVRSQEFITHVMDQVQRIQEDPPDLLILSQHFSGRVGAWTLFPIFQEIYNAMTNEQTWLLVCEEETRIDLNKLMKTLNDYDPERYWFIGRGLVDQEPSVIHHYSFHEDVSSFRFPHQVAGFALSRHLLKTICDTLSYHERSMEFSIDPKHELAKYLQDELPTPVQLTSLASFCLDRRDFCITWQTTKFPECGKPVPLDDIFFAVKTCQKYHPDRIPVIKDTWANDVLHIEYYSDFADPNIPTIDLGVPNVERGHCLKTLAILRRAYLEPHIRYRKWFVLADDDTLFSVPRLQRLLACYDDGDNIALGERYGYGVSSGRGYDYITLGGGMVLSRAAVVELIESKTFSCPSSESLDDMLLGMALQNLQVPVVHSSLFHQARPMDYAKDYLASQDAVSFHRYWACDPRKVYRDYLHVTQEHDEL